MDECDYVPYFREDGLWVYKLTPLEDEGGGYDVSLHTRDDGKVELRSPRRFGMGHKVHAVFDSLEAAYTAMPGMRPGAGEKP